MKKCVFTLLAVVLFINVTKAQILNVESQRILQDSAGWVGKADVSFDITSNQKQVLALSSALHAQYRQNRHTYILLGGAGMIRADKNDFDNSGHIHFRYNYDLSRLVTIEAFLQGQYNRVLMVDHRELTGTGARLLLLNTHKSRLYAATLYMFEREALTEALGKYNHHRMSSYLALNLSFNDHVSMNNIVYYQPRLDFFSDRRFVVQSSLKFRITKMLGFTVDFNLYNDSYPPPGIKKTVYSVKNGFRITL